MLHQAERMTVLGLETKTRDKARYPLVTHLSTNAKVILIHQRLSSGAIEAHRQAQGQDRCVGGHHKSNEDLRGGNGGVHG